MSGSKKTGWKKTASVSMLLPQDIIVEIFSKLPAKSLVRFRCVSKFFCALIADHGFGVLHRSLSLTLPSRAGVLISAIPHANCSPAYYTVNFSEVENDPRRGMLQANRVGYLDAQLFLSSSSDGLFICGSSSSSNVAVCNVSTGDFIFLPAVYPQSFSNLLLGYDPESKRYKVFMSAGMPDENSRLPKYKHMIFTVGVDRSWREINNHCFHPYYPPDCLHPPYYSNPSVYIDGVIYSDKWPNKRSMVPRLHIVAFEVGPESFSVITVPDEVSSLPSYLHLKNSALLEVGGRLAMVLLLVPKLGRRGVQCYMNVWTWEKSMKCWEKITINIPLEWNRMIKKASLYFATNYDGEIVCLSIYHKQFYILVYNLKSEVWRKFDVCGVEDFPIVRSWQVTLHNVVDHVFPLE